jgi:hypothetical protein
MSEEPAWKKLSLRELVDAQIWYAVMEGTAWCGWTARKGLVQTVQENVKWALDQHLALAKKSDND